MSQAGMATAATAAQGGCVHGIVNGAKAFKKGIFGAFYVLSKKMPVESQRARVIGQMVTLLQLLSFLNAPNVRWSSLPSLQWLHWISNLLSVQGFSFLNNNIAYLVVFYVAMAWTTAFCGLFIATMAMFISGSFPVLWPLKVLRLIAGVTVDQLYIPLLSSLLTQFLCSSNPFWTASGYVCFQGGHLAQTPIVVILIILLVLLCSGFALLFYDAAILSRSYSARVHGRLDLVSLLVMKTVLTIFVKTFPYATTVYGVVGLLLATGFIYGAAVLYFMPYTHHFSNRTDAAVASCFFYGALTVLLSQVLPSLDAGVLLLVGIPLAAIVGVWAADYRAQAIYFKPVSDLSGPIEFEQKCRYLLHEALFGHYVKELHALGEEPPPYQYAPGDAESAAAVSIFSGRPEAAVDKDSASRLSGTKSTAGSVLAASTSLAKTAGSAAVPAGIDPATGKALSSPPAEAVAKTRQEMEQRLSDPDDTDALLETARQFLSPVDIARIEGVYKAGVKRFKMDGLLHIALARWYLDMRKNKHLFMSSLLQAERGNGPLGVDIGFVIFNARKKSEDSSGSQGSMSAMLRVSFEKHLADAKKSVIRAASAQLAFWSELLAPLPDLGRLHKASSDMADAETQAEQAFSQLLELSPQSLLVLRMYSEFQLKIRNNPEKAALLTAEAERIEESAAKEHSKDSSSSLKIMEQSPLDVMSDSVGLIQISGNPHTLGIITAVNTTAARMLGYAKWQLLRRNINMIIPEPFSAWHDHFLRRFLASGEGNVLDYTRCLLAIHRNGHAFPLLVCVREVPSDQTNGGAAEFVGLLRPVTTPEQHMMLDADFKITAATAGSLQALDLEPSSLQQDVSLRDFIPELDRILDDLMSPKGATVALDSQHAKAMAAARISAANNTSGGQGPELLGGALVSSSTSGQIAGPGASTAATIQRALSQAYNKAASVAASARRPGGQAGKRRAIMPQHAHLASEEDEDGAGSEHEFSQDLIGNNTMANSRASRMPGDASFRGQAPTTARFGSSSPPRQLTRRRATKRGSYEALQPYDDSDVDRGASDDDGDDNMGEPEIVWGRCQIQKVVLRSGLMVYILYWQKLFLDPVTKAQAEMRRREMLQTMIMAQQGQQQQPQGWAFPGQVSTSLGVAVTTNPLASGLQIGGKQQSSHSSNSPSLSADEDGSLRRSRRGRSESKKRSAGRSDRDTELSATSPVLDSSAPSSRASSVVAGETLRKKPSRSTGKRSRSTGGPSPKLAAYHDGGRNVNFSGMSPRVPAAGDPMAGTASNTSLSIAAPPGIRVNAHPPPLSLDALLMQAPSQRAPPHPATHVFSSSPSGVSDAPSSNAGGEAADAAATNGNPSWVAPLLPNGHPTLPPGTVKPDMSPQEAYGRCPALLRMNVFANLDKSDLGGGRVAERPGTSGSVFASASHHTGVMLAARRENTGVKAVDSAATETDAEPAGTDSSLNLLSFAKPGESSSSPRSQLPGAALPPSTVPQMPTPSKSTSVGSGIVQPTVVSARPSDIQLLSHLPQSPAVQPAPSTHQPSPSVQIGSDLFVRRASAQRLAPDVHSDGLSPILSVNGSQLSMTGPMSPNPNPGQPTSILRRGSMERNTVAAAGAVSSPNGAHAFPGALARKSTAGGNSFMTSANANSSSAYDLTEGQLHHELQLVDPANPSSISKSASKRGSVHGGGDESDSRSSGSGVSASRVSAVRRLLARLRRQLNDGDQSELLPALKWLRLASVGVWLLALGLTVAVVSVSWTSLTKYGNNLKVASSSSHLIDSSQRLGFAAREMTLINQGWIVPPNQYIPLSSPLATPALISMVNDFTGGAFNSTAGGIYGSTLIVPGWLNLLGELVAQTARFADLLNELYTYALSTGNDGMYTTQDTAVYSFVPNPVTGQLEEVVSVVSLREACLQFVAEAKAVAALPAPAVVVSNPAVSFVLAHSLMSSPLQIMLNETMFQFATQSNESKKTVHLTLTAIYASLSVLLLLCALAVFLPILWFVDSSKDLVVRHFTFLPRKVLEKLREGAEGQARRLADEDDDEEEDQGNVDDDDNVKKGEFTAVGMDSDDDGALFEAGLTQRVLQGDADVEGATPDISRSNTQAVPLQENKAAKQAASRGDKASGSEPADGEDWEALFKSSSKRGGSEGNGNSSDSGTPGGVLPAGYGMSAASTRRLLQAANSYGVQSARQMVPGSHSGPSSPVPGAGSFIQKGGQSWHGPNGGPPIQATLVSQKSGQDLRTYSIAGSSVGSGPTGSGASVSSASYNFVAPRFSKSIRPLLSLLAKYVAPLAVLWVFFTILYFTSRSTLDVTAATSSLALAGNSRAVLITSLATQVRVAASTPGSPADVEQLVSGVVQTSIDLAYFHRLLVIGGVPASPDLQDASKEAATNGNAGLSSSQQSEVNALLFGDACSELWADDPSTFPTNPAVTVESLNLPTTTVQAQTYAGTTAIPGANLTDCSRMLSGAISRGGLNSGLQQLLRTASGFVSRRAAAIIAPSAAFGTGNMTTLFSSPQLPVALGIPPPAWIASNQYARSGPDGIPYGGFVVMNPATGELEWVYEVRSWNGSALSWSATWEPYSLSFELSSPGMWAVKEAGTKYLPAASYDIAQRYTNSGLNSISVFVIFQIAFSVSFLVVYFLFLVLVVLPSIRRESELIRKQRGLMLLLPPVVLRLSRDLRNLLVAIVSGGATVTSSSGSSGNSMGQRKA